MIIFDPRRETGVFLLDTLKNTLKNNRMKKFKFYFVVASAIAVFLFSSCGKEPLSCEEPSLPGVGSVAWLQFESPSDFEGCLGSLMNGGSVNVTKGFFSLHDAISLDEGGLQEKADRLLPCREMEMLLSPDFLIKVGGRLYLIDDKGVFSTDDDDAEGLKRVAAGILVPQGMSAKDRRTLEDGTEFINTFVRDGCDPEEDEGPVEPITRAPSYSELHSGYGIGLTAKWTPESFGNTLLKIMLIGSWKDKTLKIDSSHRLNLSAYDLDSLVSKENF